MSIETGRSGYEESVERVELPFGDELLAEAVVDQEGSRALYATEPVMWLRAAIGADTERGASAISDVELAERYSQGGFAEWDPKLRDTVASYLHGQGFVGFDRTHDA